MKKALSILLSLVVILAALPLTAVDAFAYTDSHYEYTVANNQATITRYTGTETDIIIPETLGGYVVQRISEAAFLEIDSLETITILPDSIQEIEANAIRACHQLNTLVIPGNVTVDRNAVSDCSAQLTIYGESGSTAEACADSHSISFCPWEDIFSWSVNNYEATITDYFGLLPYVIVPSVLNGHLVTGIDYEAFYHRTSSSRIFISEGITWIGDSAFLGCSSLVSVSLPDSLTTIGRNAFARCDSLASVPIPDSVTCIDDMAFFGCSALTTVIIPNSVTSIGSGAFLDCSPSLVLYGSAGSCAKTYAQESSLTFVAFEDIFTYTVGNNGATITGYTGTAPQVIIPATLAGYDVTAIGNNAFRGNTFITGVVIPDSVTTLGTNVFDSCTALASVTFGIGLSAIGEYDFRRCVSLTNVMIPGNIQTIGRNAFDYCSGITELHLCPGLVTIGIAAFGSNTGLTQVTLPNTVTTLCEAAFGSCTNLSRIDIPASVTRIDNKAFERDPNVNAYITDLAAWCAINFNNGAGQYYSNPCESGGNLYLNGTLIENLVIPAGVTAIAQGAFDGCSAIKNAVIPEGVTAIKDYTFRGCTGLESITIPSTVTSISGNYTFQNCSALNAVNVADLAAWCDIAFTNENSNPLFQAHNLYLTNSAIPTTTVTIPSTVTTIKPYVFAGLANDVVIPANVTAVGNYAFYKSTMANATLNEGLLTLGNGVFAYNPNLTAIDLPDTLTTIGNEAFRDCYALKDVEIGTGLTALGEYDFYDCTAIEELTIPGNIATVGNYAFDLCKGIETLNLNPGLVTIGNAAFGTNTSLKRVSLPNTVTTIGRYAFGTCSSLEWIDIPASVTDIGGYAFEKNNEFVTNITDLSAWCRIHFNGTAGQYYSNPTEQGHKLYLNGEPITNLVIPSDVTSITPGAFDRCLYITSVTIPDSVTTVGQYAFRGSCNIETLRVGKNVTSFGTMAFSECTGLTGVYIDDVAAWCAINFPNDTATPLYVAHNLYVNDVLTTVTVPNTVTQIKQYTFAGLANDIVIDGSVQSIDYKAFYKATTADVTLNEGLLTIGNEAFSGCQNLTAIDLPHSLTTMGNYVFSECSALQDVGIGSGLSAIGEYDFYKCTALEEITIPGNIVTIGNNAFDRCTRLETLHLNPGLETIGYAAFGTNSSLKRVSLPGTVTTIGSHAFGTCSSLEWIDIPASVTAIGSYAFESTPEFVTNITDVAAWCAINFNNGAGQYYSCPMEKGHLLYLNGEPLTDLVIPEGVTSIAQGAFDGCTTIQTVRLPSTLTEIKGYTFRTNSNLQYLVVPASVTAINSGALSACNALTNIICYKDSYAATYIPSKTAYLGDMDGDKDFTATDFSAAVNASLDAPENLTVLQRALADYNMDGVVDALDCRLVKLLSQGKEIPV